MAMYKIAVLGNPDTVLGFRALGLDTYPIANPDEAKSVFRRVTEPDEDYAIIYLEERFSAALSQEIALFREKTLPAIILIPGRDGNQGLGLTALREAVLRAVGADIL